MRKVLIANRGEIAVRVSRACRDAGIASVAVYAEPDRDAMHVCAADEAFALGGDGPATSYLDVAKVLRAAADSGADAVHPGYGFLSDNADFAQAVLDAGLIWIGPPPRAIRALTDKITTRQLARSAGAPPLARTPNPDRARHVETQCLADRHGTVVVVSTRDCTLRRRGRTLVAEAPAPFLTPEQDSLLRTASKAILTEAGYVGAGTCEFLLAPDGAISFIGVNTGLRVEHPATEEITGIDLVREQFRIADGAALGYDDPEIRGHAIEFRIYGEDAGQEFLPTPGTVRLFIPPSGPGVRLDTGVRPGTIVRPGWDPLLAKLIITGATRTQALQRATRALAEFTVDGLATLIPFHRAVVTDPAFSGAPLRVHTRWIEAEFDNRIAPYVGAGTGTESVTGRETVVVEIGGKRIEVTVPAALAGAAANSLAAGKRRPQRGSAQKSVLSGDTLAAPMQGTVLKVAVRDGQQVAAGELVVVLEAMKMEQPLRAHKAGTIVGLQAVIGQSVSTGAALCEIKD